MRTSSNNNKRCFYSTYMGHYGLTAYLKGNISLSSRLRTSPGAVRVNVDQGASYVSHPFPCLWSRGAEKGTGPGSPRQLSTLQPLLPALCPAQSCRGHLSRQHPNQISSAPCCLNASLRSPEGISLHVLAVPFPLASGPGFSRNPARLCEGHSC